MAVCIEVIFKEEITDSGVDDISQELHIRFGSEIELDWRDDTTLWIWVPVYEDEIAGHLIKEVSASTRYKPSL